MKKYKCLKNQVFVYQEYSIVPIRYVDRFKIMNWRNEQIYHLRQKIPLTIDDQNNYFHNVISKIFNLEKPNQVLFSFLKGDVCIGYGGLVHINWIDMKAEVSFIMDTLLQDKFFKFLWLSFIKMIEKVAFNELNLSKIFTYAFDLREELYPVLDEGGFVFESRLKDDCLFNGTYIDSVIYSKTNYDVEV